MRIVIFEDWEVSMVRKLYAGLIVKSGWKKEPYTPIPLIVLRHGPNYRVCCEVEADEGTFSPIQQSCWNVVMSCEKEPLPFRLWTLQYKLDCVLLEYVDERPFLLYFVGRPHQ